MTDKLLILKISRYWTVPTLTPFLLLKSKSETPLQLHICCKAIYIAMCILINSFLSELK